MTKKASPTSAVDTRITPISLPDLKDQLRIDHSDQDRMLIGKIKAAVSEIEAYIDGPVIQRSMTLKLSAWEDEIQLLPGPVLAIVSIRYYDTDNVQQTLDAADYELYEENRIDRLVAVSDWPVVYDRKDAIEIVYQAGLAASVTQVPTNVKEAVLLRASTRYSMPEEAGIGTVAWNIENDFNAESLLMPYKLMHC